MFSKAMIFAIALAGCSFTMRSLPGSWTPEQGAPSCDSGFGAPVADLVMGALGTAVGGVTTLLAPICEENETRCRTSGLVILIPGLAAAIAGVVGVERATRCIRANSRYEEYRHAQ